MKKNTIVFLPEGFNLSHAQKLSLQDIFKQDMEIYHESASIDKNASDINTSYKRRKDSFYHAFLFIMRAIPLVPESRPDVHLFLAHSLAESTPLDSKSLAAHKKALAIYLDGFLKAIQYYWGVYYTQAVEWLEKAEQYLLLERGRSDLATLSVYEGRHGKKHYLKWEKQLPPCPVETLRELDQIRNNDVCEEMPGWYIALPAYEKQFLNTILRDSGDLPIDEVFSFIPSGITAFPALSEFSEQHLIVLNETGEIFKRFPKLLTSGVPVTSEMEIQPGSLEDIHCLRNLRHVSTYVDNAWSIQTLTDHIKNLHGYMPFNGELFGSFLYLQLCKSLSDLKKEEPGRDIYFTTHSLIPKTEHLDSIMPEYDDNTGVDYEECSVFLEGMERDLAKNPDNFVKLQEIKQQYEKIISPETTPTTASVYYSRPQWLLSLENVAMQNRGVSYSIYEPGNGRKAIHLMHTNTVMLYESNYGEWPNILDSGKKREDFNKLFAHLFHTKHFQRLNELSAPGSLGIRNVSQYLLPDTLRTIYDTTDNCSLLEVENHLALNYQLDSCIGVKMPAWDLAYMPCLLRAIRLSVENRIALVGHLKDLIKDESFWLLKITLQSSLVERTFAQCGRSNEENIRRELKSHRIFG